MYIHGFFDHWFIFYIQCGLEIYCFVYDVFIMIIKNQFFHCDKCRDDDTVMEKKKSSAKTKLSRNKKKAETKINILTITGDLNETCEFKKPEKILSKSSTVKSLTLKKSEEKIIPSISNEKISRQNLITEPECETENSKCPACLLVIQGNLQCHLQTCLKRKFGRNGAPKKEGKF